MSVPKRIQRKRTKGWRMPEGAVYVGRPSRWGNPFRIGPAVYYSVTAGHGASMNTRPADAVRIYRDWLSGRIFDCEVREYDHRGIPAPRKVAAPLDQPCHADVLLEIANGVRP